MICWNSKVIGKKNSEVTLNDYQQKYTIIFVVFIYTLHNP
jgi:hypothetical protein